MKTQLHYILFLSWIVILTIASPSFAQESYTPEVESIDVEHGGIDKEKIMNSPGEGDFRYIPKSGHTTGDSATNASASTAITLKVQTEKQPPTPKPAVEKQSKEEDDSILSFNFLYYIIQKYKLQDIVD